MCGISGIITREKLSDRLKAAVSGVNAAQAHRGPDGAGEFSSDHILLAMRRLSIIDPEGGWQPLYNEDKSLVLIVNGEIYNYIELRERLKAAGHRFRTDADGEVILHLYEENDSDFVTHLRGMFAFALWDVKRRRLVLVRDRMGEKPLYLFERDGELLFASELKGLLHSGLVPFELNPRAVNLYFHYQYVPEPLTPLKGVRKLNAARMLIIDVESWQIKEREYWRMEDAPPLDGEPGELVREKLEEVSRLIVRSDVPVGVALSGGLDSSVVAAFAARQSESLCAFSVGYAGRPECDERTDAAAFARHLNLPFYDVELDTRAIVEFFPQLNYWRDDPVADISGFGYYSVMKLAREHGVPVLLQGQGGDELFWGYPQLREAARENRLKSALLQKPFSQAILQTLTLQLPNRRSARGILSWARNFGGLRSGWQNTRRRRAVNSDRMIFYDLSPDFVMADAHAREFYSSKFLERIYDDDAAELFTFSDGWKSTETRLTRLICDTYLRENGIVQGDRLGMASSVEMRLPLIDYKLVETVVGLRKRKPDSHLPPKFWLKEAVKDVLPDWVLNRPKRGFAPPTREWHRALFDAYGESLRDGYLAGSEVLSGDGAARLAEGEFPAGATSPLSFKALVLEQWCRQMIGINLPK
ncbi:MAG TPA: asparagine synthase (glutamine-hydrolyzing) [Pyrinomonadaceae bacterium]|nr:asparagine synthase (glutamine-hydrolyzing) [Pyrinomonadaceae bacterium]